MYDTDANGKKKVSRSGSGFGHFPVFNITATEQELDTFADAWLDMSKAQRLKFAIKRGWVKSDADYIRDENERRTKWTEPYTDVVAVKREIHIGYSISRVSVHGLAPKNPLFKPNDVTRLNDFITALVPGIASKLERLGYSTNHMENQLTYHINAIDMAALGAARFGIVVVLMHRDSLEPNAEFDTLNLRVTYNYEKGKAVVDFGERVPENVETSLAVTEHKGFAKLVNAGITKAIKLHGRVKKS